MAMNTAEQLEYEDNLAQANPQPIQQPDRQIVANPGIVPGRVSFSKFELVVIAVCGIVVLCMSLFLVSTRNQVTSAQHELQNVNSHITKVNSQNDSNKQVIDELTSSNHLQQVAQKSGLSINSDIRNVNK